MEPNIEPNLHAGGELIVHLRGIHLTLPSAAGPVDILRGVDFTVAGGERVAVLGPSGSGKSTLLSIIAGLERPSSGDVVIAGRNFATLDEDGLALFRRRHVGILFQSFHLIPTMTALENVAIPLELARRSDAFAEAEAGLRAVEMGHRLTHYPGQLSGGEQQRVALARALAGAPGLLLADEPTGNLDQATGGHVIDLLFALQRSSATTLILVTHDPALAERCGRRVHMADGRFADDAAARIAAS